MIFLTLLIVLGLVQLWGSGGMFQRDDWFFQIVERVNQWVGSAPIRLVIIVGIPCLLLLFVLNLLEGKLLGLLSLLVYVSVLLFSLGRGDFNENLQHYLSYWNHGNFESAYEKAEKIGDFKQGEQVVEYRSLHEGVRSAFIYQGFERWFAVIFWFLILGPFGALCYRLSFLSAHSSIVADREQQLALRLVHYLDWLPARLLAFTFSLTGNFVNGFNRCWQSLPDNQPINELLESSALAAISGPDGVASYPEDQQDFIDSARRELLSLQALLARSVVCWLVIIALLELFSV